MKYLTRELHIKYFGGKTFNDNEDKFLIGHLNNQGNRLIDSVTGQIVEDNYFSSLRSLYSASYDMALGYMTNFRASDSNFIQRLEAEYIDSVISKDLLDTKQIARIKNILNREIIRTHEKEEKINERIRAKNDELDQYSISEIEKDF